MFWRTLFKPYKSALPLIYFLTSCSRLSGTTTINVQKQGSPLKAISGDKSITIHWEDSRQSKYHHVWLRHHCQCTYCLNPETHQRTIDMALIPSGISPKQVAIDNNEVKIEWNDGHQSCFNSSWLRENAYDGAHEKAMEDSGLICDESDMFLWDKNRISSNFPPDFHYDTIHEDPNTINHLLVYLHRFGFIFVDGTPLDDEAVPSLCEIIGGFVLNTVFGRSYKIGNTGMTHADIAYFNPALNAHSGHAYFTTPAGLQALHVTFHDGTGGETLLVDGFNAAKTLHKEDPESYEVLTNTYLPFQYIGKKHTIKNYRTILEVDPIRGQLLQLRYNNYRVGPLIGLNMSYDRMGKFYDAIRLFGSILHRPENEHWFKLKPGRVLIMDNRRLLHGRSEVTGLRKLVGCYVSMDDYIGKWRCSRDKLKKNY